MLYAVLLHGRVAMSQFLIAAYAGIAMVSVLRLLNWSLLHMIERLLVRTGGGDKQGDGWSAARGSAGGGAGGGAAAGDRRSLRGIAATGISHQGGP